MAEKRASFNFTKRATMRRKLRNMMQAREAKACQTPRMEHIAMLNEQMAFSEIERLSRIALEAGDLNKLQGILLPLLREDDRTRAASENLFIYRTLGSIYEEQGHHKESLMAYEQAHGYDGRDFETLSVLANEEFSKAPESADMRVLLDWLVFHRGALKPLQVMRVFKTAGDAHVARGEHVLARECYEKALEARPGDMDLINALLKVSEATGDEEALRASREKLLDSMSAPESRAAVLVSIGDDYLNRLKDEKKALAMYEEALSEFSQSTAAHGRILVIAERTQDWERSLNALSALVSGSDDSEEKCKYILKMAWIFKEKLGNLRRAVDLFNDVLDIRPEQVKVFEEIVSILQSQQDYVGLESNFERMIERLRHLEPVPVKLMTGLCMYLGELRSKQLNNIRGAAQAYKVASELDPDNVKFHIVLAKLYGQMGEYLKEAVHENREILRLAPDRLEAVEALARCYRSLEQFDASLCVFRVLSVLGMNSEEGKAIVERYATDSLPQITRHLSEEEWKLIRPKTLNLSLLRIFAIVAPIIGDLFSHDPDHYGITAKESRLDLTADTVFVRALKLEATALGFAEVPNVYRTAGVFGVQNAYFSQRSFLVNPNVLSGRTASEVAFITSKALLLMRPEFYLLGLGIESVEAILRVIIKTIFPSQNILLDKNQQQVARTLEKGLSNAERNELGECIVQLTKRKTGLNMALFMESVEEFANRVGLLFSDDLSIIEKQLVEEDQNASGKLGLHPISARKVADRIGSLLVWGMSEEYMQLRRGLGISIAGQVVE